MHGRPVRRLPDVAVAASILHRAAVARRELWFLSAVDGPAANYRACRTMPDDLYALVRSAYARAAKSPRDARIAMERAVQVILDRKPSLSREEARQAAVRILGSDPRIMVEPA